MSDPINISEVREAFAKTTQGEWEAIVCVLSPRVYCDGEMICETHAAYLVDAGNHDMDWIAKVHNDYLAMLDELERLRETVAKQQAELGEYWRAAVAIESEITADSDRGLADLHEIRTGNNYSQVGPSVAEMLVGQRDELAKEVERLKLELSNATKEFDRVAGWSESVIADAFCEQQSQPVNERLITLLEAVSIQDFGMFVDDVDGKNWFDLRDEAIAAAKAEITERAKPVTREWLRSIGSVRVPDDVYPHSEGNDNEQIGNLRLWGFDETGTWYMQGADWFGIKTRGQVLDLLRATGHKVKTINERLSFAVHGRIRKKKLLDARG